MSRFQGRVILKPALEKRSASAFVWVVAGIATEQGPDVPEQMDRALLTRRSCRGCAGKCFT
jgi:hypothetical protein